MSRFIIVFRYTFLQLVRNVPAMIFLLLMPLFIIVILGSVFSWIPAGTDYLKGAANTSTFFAIGMMVFFQLFGGSYSMANVRASFLTPRRWRIYSLPCPPMLIVSGILAAATVVSLIQGLFLVVLSELILGAQFGNIGVVLVVLVGLAVLSQLIGIVLLLLVRNTTAAFVLGWVVAYGSGVLGGMIFPLPADVPFFQFTRTYGTPFSLAQTALLDSSRGGPAGEIALCIGVLFLAGAVLACLTALLGKRKLA
jgi:ABC-2 type transport system permease protein